MTKKISFIVFKIIYFIDYLLNKIFKRNFLDYFKEFLEEKSYKTIYIHNRKINFFTPTHTALFKTSINIYKDNPIFGSGLKTFKSECNNKKYKVSELGCSTHPHNIYLNILSETGIIVFIFFIIFYSYICLFLIKNWSEKFVSNYKSFEFILYLSLFINFFPIAPSGSFFNNWLSIIFYYPIGVIIWLKSKIYEKDNN